MIPCETVIFTVENFCNMFFRHVRSYLGRHRSGNAFPEHCLDLFSVIGRLQTKMHFIFFLKAIFTLINFSRNCLSLQKTATHDPRACLYTSCTCQEHGCQSNLAVLKLKKLVFTLDTQCCRIPQFRVFLTTSLNSKAATKALPESKKVKKQNNLS